MGARADRDDPGRPVRGQGLPKPEGQAKWPRWFVANCISQPSGVRCSGIAMTPRVVDEKVEFAGPAGDEGGDRGPVGQVEPGDPDMGIAGRADDVRRRPVAGLGVADGQGHLGTDPGERPGRLDPDPGGSSGDDRPPAGEVDPPGDLVGRGPVTEGGGDAGHSAQEILGAGPKQGRPGHGFSIRTSPDRDPSLWPPGIRTNLDWGADAARETAQGSPPRRRSRSPVP